MSNNNFMVYDFNLTALLKLSDLNIRHAAEENKKLSVGEYFRMLSQFLNLAPDASSAIKRFANDDSLTMDWKIIRDIIAFLKELSCEKYLPDLNTIRNACVEGNHRLAAFHAEKIEQSFNNFYSHVMDAKITKEANYSPRQNPKSQSATTTLFSRLKELDEKETGHKLVVLTVDDSPAVLEAVSALLSGEYSVFKLPKPEMLVDVLKQVKPDLFLLDYQMPGLNGLELIPIIRGHEEHKDTPIIFLTAEGTIDNITAAIGLGACDFIVKPFQPDQLKEKIAKHIVRKDY